MKKPIIPITILACFSISSLLGCKAPANGPDRDYDGIINGLDPAPDDNTYFLSY